MSHVGAIILEPNRPTGNKSNHFRFHTSSDINKTTLFVDFITLRTLSRSQSFLFILPNDSLWVSYIQTDQVKKCRTSLWNETTIFEKWNESAQNNQYQSHILSVHETFNNLLWTWIWISEPARFIIYNVQHLTIKTQTSMSIIYI